MDFFIFYTSNNSIYLWNIVFNWKKKEAVIRFQHYIGIILQRVIPFWFCGLEAISGKISR